MRDIQLSQNIIHLRREKNVTQEQLAEHIGVTKGAVSKWENGSTLPDVTTLPLLAAYFDVSVDALLGYAPWLTAQNIKETYQTYAKAFSTQPFFDVYEKIKADVKTYYACWPFLFQMSVLLLNHYTQAKEDGRNEILSYIGTLLERIEHYADNTALKSDAKVLQAMVWLQQGNYDDAIKTLKEFVDPFRLTNQSDGLLVQAYLMRGERLQADRYAQVGMYLSLQSLITQAINHMTIHAQDQTCFTRTVLRMESVIDAFELSHLNPNLAAQFHFQAAILALGHENRAEAFHQLEKFIAAMEELFSDKGFRLHGDEYFNLLDEWIAELEQTNAAPRDRDTVRREVLRHFEQPFAAIVDDPEFRRLHIKLKAVLG